MIFNKKHGALICSALLLFLTLGTALATEKTFVQEIKEDSKQLIEEVKDAGKTIGEEGKEIGHNAKEEAKNLWPNIKDTFR